MMFGEDEGLSARGQAIAVAFFYRFRSFPLRYAEVLASNRQEGAGQQSHQVKGISGGRCFVEVVNAPNQTSFPGAPGAKIFYMQVPYAQDHGSLENIFADLRPLLQPAIKCCAEKRKGFVSHALVF